MRRDTPGSPPKTCVSISSMSLARPATTGWYPSTTASRIA